MSSFIDTDPTFPYQSSEASKHLGLPDSPEIHLAVTAIAEVLIPIVQMSGLEEPLQRITALRMASEAALFGWPLSAVEQEARDRLGLPVVQGIELPQHWISNEKDRLAEAADQLRHEGVRIDPNFQRQRSNYGWKYLKSPS